MEETKTIKTIDIGDYISIPESELGEDFTEEDIKEALKTQYELCLKDGKGRPEHHFKIEKQKIEKQIRFTWTATVPEDELRK